MPDLRTTVFTAMQFAAKNGCHFRGQTVEEIAEDMNRYCSDVEGREPAELVPHIREWQSLAQTAKTE